jgi:hypothetical protein
MAVYSDTELASASTARLIELLTADEDRAPRNVIDECAQRGEEMLDHLSRLAADDRYWGEECSQGEWWLLLHGVMILGLMPSARAGLLLVEFMRRMSEAEAYDLQDWFAGNWPALFRNKPDEVLPAVRALCENRSLNWYLRTCAMEPVVATAQWRGAEALDAALAWVAGIAADESEEWDSRMFAGNVLVDFPRKAYRSLVEALAREQEGPGAYFSLDNVRDAYAAGRDRPQWERFDNPWSFYDPEAIAERQERWQEEDSEDDAPAGDPDDDLFGDVMVPYVRPAPKIGRNEPCPCGSGKKYKKCCLPVK